MTTTPRPDREYRLGSSARIGELFDGGMRVAEARGMLVGGPNDLGHPRLAIAVSRRHGKAVRRNRVRRLCREAFRAIRGGWDGGWDLVFVPQARDDHSVEAFAAAMQRLFARLERRAARGGGPAGPAAEAAGDGA